MGFLLTVLAIWSAMHAYAWARVRAYAHLGAAHSLLIALAFLAFMSAPILGLLLTRRGDPAGRPLEMVGMLWAGAFWLFFSVSVVHDLYNVGVSLCALIVPAARSARWTGAAALAGDAALALALAAYGLVEAQMIRTEHVRIASQKLPVERLRIVQIADLHLGASTGMHRLRRIARLVEAARPDILVSTGDLWDADPPGGPAMAMVLDGLAARHGNYAVTGNHEYYAGIERSRKLTSQAGFGLISNDVRSALPGLSIVGFDDDTARFWNGGSRWDESAILARVPEGNFTIVLKHRPVVADGALGRFDLQISGHTHRGQIFPFTLFVLAHYKHPHGLVEIAPGQFLYTSRGTGTWGPPMRVFNPPEVTVFDIVRSQ